jgi:hypothetical protein
LVGLAACGLVANLEDRRTIEFKLLGSQVVEVVWHSIQQLRTPRLNGNPHRIRCVQQYIQIKVQNVSEYLPGLSGSSISKLTMLDCSSARPIFQPSFSQVFFAWFGLWAMLVSGSSLALLVHLSASLWSC